MKNEFKSIIKIRMCDGSLVNWDSLSHDEKKEIGIRLNKQGMLAVGFKEVKATGETA